VELRFMLIGGVLPGFIATVLLLAGWFLLRPKGDRVGPVWLLPLLIAASIIPAQLLTQGYTLPRWPVNAADRMPHIVLAAALFGFVHALTWRFRAARLLIPFLAVGVCSWMFLSYRHPSFWKAGDAVLWTGIFTLGGGALALLLDRSAAPRTSVSAAPATAAAHSPRRDPAPAVVLFIAANAVPLLIVQSGNAYLAQIAGGVVAALGAAAFIAFPIPSFTVARGGVTTAVATLVPLGIAGFYFAETGLEPRIELLLAALGAALGATALLLLPNASMWKRLFIGAAAAGIPTAVALGLMLSRTSQQTKPPSEYDMYREGSRLKIRSTTPSPLSAHPSLPALTTRLGIA